MKLPQRPLIKIKLKSISMNKVKISLVLIATSLLTNVKGQEVIDQVVAVVGKKIVLQSEVEANYQQALLSPDTSTTVSKCQVFEELLYQRLLVTQAQKDSVVVSPEQVDGELDRRLSYYIQQFGSKKKLEAFYGKTTAEFKSELRENVHDLIQAQQIQAIITGDVTATPSEVKEYYNSLSKDDIPYIDMEVEVGHLVKQPVASETAKAAAKEKLELIKQRIEKGETSFSTMAALYSEDPGSAKKGGLYEGIQRGQFVPEWEAWAFKLKPNEISDVFESVYGYFLVQLIERRGNEVDARSLLISPKVDGLMMLEAKEGLDNIYKELTSDSITFKKATELYSDEGSTKYNEGLIVNPFTGTTSFKMNELGQVDQNIAFAIEKLQPGEFTKPMPMNTTDGKRAYHILYLKSKKAPHIANLKDDYQLIQATTLANKKQAIIQEWINRKAKSNYISIIEEYKNCPFKNNWEN